MPSRKTDWFDSLVQPMTALPSKLGAFKTAPESVNGNDITVWRYEIPRISEIFSFIINKEELFRFDRIQLCRLSCGRFLKMCRTIANIIFPIRSSRPADRIWNLPGPIR